ncbi:rhamnogalacturonan lyase, partial [Streptosporangium sp. NPDC002721]
MIGGSVCAVILGGVAAQAPASAAVSCRVTYEITNQWQGGFGANVTNSTNHLDAGAAADASYTVRAVSGGTEGPASETSLRFGSGYLDVPISPPSSGHHASDAAPADLDGDGRMDIVLKWEANNAKDNSQSGVTDPVYLDGVKLDGTRLWRINLGRNIRAGAHYTQFQAYDYDGDGRAEVAMKTADGTVDGRGTVIGSASADHRNSGGYVLAG